MISQQLGPRVATTSAKLTRRQLRPRRRCEIGSLIIELAIKCGTPEQTRPHRHSVHLPRVVDAVQKADVICGQSVGSCTLAEQRDIAERRSAIDLFALSNVSDGLDKLTFSVLRF